LTYNAKITGDTRACRLYEVATSAVRGWRLVDFFVMRSVLIQTDTVPASMHHLYIGDAHLRDKKQPILFSVDSSSLICDEKTSNCETKL
jgi:hypothetical protein